MLKKLLILSSLVVGLSNAAYAASPADWSADFLIGPKHNHTISHTPSQVCLDGMICGGTGVHLGAHTSLNGVDIGECALDLKTEMTKPEFIAAMKCSGLDPIEKKHKK